MHVTELATGINTETVQAASQLSLSLSGYLAQFLQKSSLGEPEDLSASMGSCQLLTSLVLSMCCHVLSTTAWYIHIVSLFLLLDDTILWTLLLSTQLYSINSLIIYLFTYLLSQSSLLLRICKSFFTHVKFCLFSF